MISLAPVGHHVGGYSNEPQPEAIRAAVLEDSPYLMAKGRCTGGRWAGEGVEDG